MKYITLLLCFLIPASLLANIDQDLTKADQLFQTRHQKTHLSESINVLQNAIKNAKTDKEKYNCYWRLSRSYSEVTDYLDTNKKEKIAMTVKGIQMGKKAKTLNPNDINGIYWTAISIGREAELKGILKSLKSVKPIKNAMTHILKIDPDFHRAHFVLSRLYRKAPKIISVGNPKKALKSINTALRLDPNESRYLLEKGLVLKKLKRKKDAKKILTDLVNLPYSPGYFKDTVNKDKEKATKLLKNLKV